jgi:hypothetical protein
LEFCVSGAMLHKRSFRLIHTSIDLASAIPISGNQSGSTVVLSEHQHVPDSRQKTFGRSRGGKKTELT